MLIVNAPLATWQPRNVFAWHLSIMMHYNERDCEEGLPNEATLAKSQEWQNEIEPFIALNPENLTRCQYAVDAHKGIRQLVYQVYNPEPPHQHLQQLIEQEKHVFPFDYEMTYDPEWERCSWMFEALQNAKESP